MSEATTLETCVGQDATARMLKHEWGEERDHAGGCGGQQGQEIG